MTSHRGAKAALALAMDDEIGNGGTAQQADSAPELDPQRHAKARAAREKRWAPPCVQKNGQISPGLFALRASLHTQI